jgi:hypothetical protein
MSPKRRNRVLLIGKKGDSGAVTCDDIKKKPEVLGRTEIVVVRVSAVPRDLLSKLFEQLAGVRPALLLLDVPSFRSRGPGGRTKESTWTPDDDEAAQFAARLLNRHGLELRWTVRKEGEGPVVSGDGSLFRYLKSQAPAVGWAWVEEEVVDARGFGYESWHETGQGAPAAHWPEARYSALGDVCACAAVAGGCAWAVIPVTGNVTAGNRSYLVGYGSRLAKRKTELVGMQDRLLNGYLSGAIEEASFQTKTAELKRQAAEVEESLERANNYDPDAPVCALALFDFSQRTAELWEGSNSEVKREILDCVSLNRTVSDVSLCLTKRKPFDFLAERPFLKNGRGGGIRTRGLVVPNHALWPS